MRRTLLLIFLCLGHVSRSEDGIRIEPKETDELFANPGMGWQTFHTFADADQNLAGLPSSSAYFRFYWREIEPRDGAIDFAKFDSLLAHARRAGQKLAFRIMCTGSGEYMDVPAWLKDAGCKGFEFTYGGGKHWVPDFSDQRFQAAHFRLIHQLGQHYNGHRDLDLVDIGSVGLWGEWHMSGTLMEGTSQPVPMPETAVCLQIIEEWCRAFAKTPKVMLIGSDAGMSQSAEKNYGWRADCLGDMGGFSKNWNHMQNYYLQQIEKTGAKEVWQKAPVAFESCWDMRKWKEAGWDIPFIFDYALKCHASYVNNKSAPIPEGTRADIEKFLKRLGYRLVVREIEHPARVTADGKLHLNIVWGNVGVAPPYRDYRVAIRCHQVAEQATQSLVLVSEQSIRGWLPGTHNSELDFQLPPSLKAGNYDVAIGVVEPETQKPAVRLAIEGRDTDGWYRVSRVECREKQ